LTGLCHGKPFRGIADLDSRLGASLEFLAAGAYHRMAFRNLRRLELGTPKNVRDLYWLPANAETTEALGANIIEQILIPVLYPQTYLFDDDLTRLGRTTDWAQTDTGTEIPCGQRILAIGGEEIPLLAIESIEFDPVAESGNPSDG
jgi:type VI secretion system protein ImpE